MLWSSNFKNNLNYMISVPHFFFQIEFWYKREIEVAEFWQLLEKNIIDSDLRHQNDRFLCQMVLFDEGSPY